MDPETPVNSPINLPMSGPSQPLPATRTDTSAYHAASTDRRLKHIFSTPWLLLMLGLLIIIGLLYAFYLFTQAPTASLPDNLAEVLGRKEPIPSGVIAAVKPYTLQNYTFDLPADFQPEPYSDVSVRINFVSKLQPGFTVEIFLDGTFNGLQCVQTLGQDLAVIAGRQMEVTRYQGIGSGTQCPKDYAGVQAYLVHLNYPETTLADYLLFRYPADSIASTPPIDQIQSILTTLALVAPPTAAAAVPTSPTAASAAAISPLPTASYTEPKQLCYQHQGTWLETHRECENTWANWTLTESVCLSAGGTYASCESPCRHQADTSFCPTVCVLVCKF